jgi:hypothetical protein
VGREEYRWERKEREENARWNGPGEEEWGGKQWEVKEGGRMVLLIFANSSSLPPSTPSRHVSRTPFDSRIVHWLGRRKYSLAEELISSCCDFQAPRH